MLTARTPRPGYDVVCVEALSTSTWVSHERNLVRAAVFGTAPGEGTPGIGAPVDTVEALCAMGNVMAELLAHHSDETTTAFLGKVRELRDAWK